MFERKCNERGRGDVAEGGGPVEDGGLRCEGCGYNLTGLTEDRCPECGRTYDKAALRCRPWTLRERLTLVLAAVVLLSTCIVVWFAFEHCLVLLRPPVGGGGGLVIFTSHTEAINGFISKQLPISALGGLFTIVGVLFGKWCQLFTACMFILVISTLAPKVLLIR